MSKRVLPLSDLQVRNAKPRDKEYALYDGQGLILLVKPTGGRLWRFIYDDFQGKRKTLTCGSYPEVSLLEARDKRTAARRQLSQGIDPRATAKAEQEARRTVLNPFEDVAREWHGEFAHTWSEGHAKTLLHRLAKDIFPWIGERPVAELKPLEILTVLQRIKDRGAPDQAHRLKFTVGQICRYAVATGRADRDPTADLRGALPPPPRGHHPAPTEPAAVAPLLKAIATYQGTLVVRTALQLSPMLFVRPGELRRMEWSEVDLEASLWEIPADKMKMKLPHVVPLCRQAVDLLTELQPLTGGGMYVFPALRGRGGRPMSENTVNAALRYLGFDGDVIVAHGFRAMARTILDEVLGVRPDIIEHQLAHAVKDPLGRAYNRTTHLEARREMMQQWADYLDGLKA